ncbi:hypothetical protein MBLNU230_g5306t1 [Neophaeotheca triangularis]
MFTPTLLVTSALALALQTHAQSASPSIDLASITPNPTATATTTASFSSVPAQTSANLLLNTDRSFVASVIDAQAGGDTTYAIVCTKGDPNFCNPEATLTLTQGPSALSIQSEIETSSAQLTVDQSCKLAGTTSVDCTIQLGFSLTETATTSTTTRVWTGDQASRNFQMVPVTAGAEKLEASAAAAATATGGVGEGRVRGVKRVVVAVAVAGVVGAMG